jgi:glycosyltransferase involved in cell wall biosynthesis
MSTGNVPQSVEDRTWLIVPLYNEGSVVRNVIEDARKTFEHIVCVDDGSSDNSVAEARAGGAVVVKHPVNLGQGAALQTGLDYALLQPDADYFVTFDSDGQHRVEDALAMVKTLDAGNVDIVIGSRFLDKRTQMGRLKKVVLKIAVLLGNLTSGVKLTDAHNGLRALNRHAASAIRITQNRMAHASEIVSEIGKKKLRYRELPVHVIYTDYSRSKGQSIWNSINILNDLYVK